MGAILSFFRPAPVARGDWSQQEIAEFYRVEAALTQSGLRITTDRGVSDEGDPWFVFCRFDGDVILHFARIDDLYVVASEAFERPLYGPDFRALLNAVAAEHPTLVPIPRKNSQSATGNLVLHPAALLAAIVATVAFQLVSADAMAGEFAGEESTVSMHQPGTEGHAFDTNPVVPGLDSHTHSVRDEIGRLTGEDEGRHARHALVLSAIALISTSLPAGQAVDATGHVLGESLAWSGRGQAVPATVVEASQAAAEGRRQQSRDEAALDASAEQSATGSGAPIQVGAALTGTASAPAIFGNIDLARLNVLGLGAAGGQEIAVMRAAESAPPPTVILVARMAAHAVPVAVEKTSAAAVTMPTGGSAPTAPTGGAPAPSLGSTAPSTATVVVGGTTAAPATAAAITAFLTVGAGETGSGHPSGGVGGSSTSAASQLSAQSQTVTTAVTASAPEKISAPSVPSPAGQPVTATANLTVRTALNNFIDQYSSAAKSSALGSDTVAMTKLSDMALTSLAKLIGTGAVSDFLASFTAYGGSATASKLVTTPTSDLTGDSLKRPTGIDITFGGTALGIPLQGSTAMSSAAPQIGTTNDKDAASSSESAAKITDKVAEKVVEAATKLASVDVVKTAPGEGPTGTGAKDAASSSESAAKITDKVVEKVVEAATKLTGADVIKTAPGESPAGTGAKDAAPSSESATKVIDKAAEKVVEATTKVTGADVTKTVPGESATGTGTQDAASSSGIATKITDKVAEKVVDAATKLASADVIKMGLGENPTGTGVKDVAPSSESAMKVTDKAAEKVVEAATKLEGGTTLDTSKLTHPTPVIAPQFLDEQGRQLIARFLETTTQVQTFVNERSFVMIDMDASHYGSPDFSVRTWSIGHDVEISIVGITADLPHAL